MAESEGAFDLEVWERVFEEGKRRCLGDKSGGNESDAMDTENLGGLGGVFRNVVGEKVIRDLKWKEGRAV